MSSKKKGAAKASPASEPTGWVCVECEQENESADSTCAACDASRPKATVDDAKYRGFVCGLVDAAEPVAGKDKLKLLKVDVGRGEPISVVTNAPNVARRIQNSGCYSRGDG
eukprot:EC118238.1.p1 GENE.EC118238.1~~EC118238.1.p1  ORF type:complete len:111 (+),score=12.60 EC118238.1:33-365(+)